jgi:hypothetical protein
MPYKSSRSSKNSKGKKSSGPLRLSKLSSSPIKGKKYRAQFSDGTHTDFGASGYSDYTKHKDPSRMKRYLDRHRKREDWNNLKSAGALSRYILWNKPSLKASVADYKKRLSSKSRGKK